MRETVGGLNMPALRHLAPLIFAETARGVRRDLQRVAMGGEGEEGVLPPAVGGVAARYNVCPVCIGKLQESGHRSACGWAYPGESTWHLSPDNAVTWCSPSREEYCSDPLEVVRVSPPDS